MIAMILFVFLVGIPTAFSADTTGTWEVEGTFADACQCTVFCSCEFSEKPTFGHCDDAAILHIEKGHYGSVKLDGMQVAVVSSSPKGERLVDTVGDLKFARIYIPEVTDEKTTEALTAIARNVFGAFKNGVTRISPDEKVEKVKMEASVSPSRYTMNIPKILQLDVAPLVGGDGKTPMILKNSLFSAAGFGDVTIGKSNLYTYTGNNMNWNYTGRSASIRPFKLAGTMPQQ